MAEYGVLIVGGNRTHQEGHAATFAAHPKCRLVASADEPDVPDTIARLNRDLAGELGIPYIPDLDKALARDDVHIVSSTPNVERRGRVAVRCIEAGKHVYLDKPLAGSLADADAIVAAAERTDAQTQMFSMIHAAWVQEAKRALDEGEVGELKALHVENLFAKGPGGTVPKGTVRREMETVERWTFVEAKREMFDVGVYCLGFVQWLTGRSFASVSCVTGNYFHREHAGVDVEDFGTMALKMDNGVTATVVSGRYGYMSHPDSGTQRIVLIGTEGTATFDAFRPRVEVYNQEPNFIPPPEIPNDPMGMWGSTTRAVSLMPKRHWVAMGKDEYGGAMAADVESFIDCIEEGREPAMNAQAAAPLTEVLLAGYASSARGEEVGLPLPRG